MEKSNSPIGIFDSGVGGLSVFEKLHELLPMESFIYLADSLNAPYGEKSKEEIIHFCKKNVDFLLEENCKLIVVACNTATTNAIEVLREVYTVPFIGIEPATKPAALSTKTGKIGVLATKGTLTSSFFMDTASAYCSDLEIIEIDGVGLVELMEKGEMEKTAPLLKKYLLPLVEKGVDIIVLGCTHYPFLVPLMKEFLPKHIQLISSGEAVAQQTLSILKKEKLISTKEATIPHSFYTNQEKEVLEAFLGRIKLKNYKVINRCF